MVTDKYNAEWQKIVEDFLEKLDDPWVEGRVAVAARQATREIKDLQRRAGGND